MWGPSRAARREIAVPRRRYVATLTLALVLALPVAVPARPADANPVTALRLIAARKGIYIGTMLDGASHRETLGGRLVGTACTEFNMLSPGNALKFDVVHPAEGRYDWTAAERLWAIAQACGQRFTGTPLVWRWQLPAWVLGYDGQPAKLRAILRDHITQVVKHFAGRITVWDVVNEAIGGDGKLIHDIWLDNLGPSYVEDAFRWARQADRTAKLYYNDFNADGMGRKGNGVFRWVTRWRARGVPIDGLGVQVHGPLQARSRAELVENLRRYARLGMETRLSEIAIPIGRGTARDLNHQAATYRTLASACFASGTNCRMFTVWGVTDRYYRPVASWKGSCCGLAFDEEFNPKPAYWALRAALLGAK